MARALELAQHGRGYVEPNPLVGAVVVRDGEIVGEGFHQRYGEAHAEINALDQAGDRTQGATLYVTLEPCCHHGKTPPCTDAILRAGICHVVVAQSDPFPQVNGQGSDILARRGVTVEVGLMESEARWLNAPYLKLLTRQKPYIHVKWAMTLDGRIATRTRQSKWISGKRSRERVHELRGRMDAIIVGAGTVRDDDPLLTARPAGPRIPSRVIIGGSGSLPEDCQLIRTAREVPVILCCAEDRVRDYAAWRMAGAEVVPTPSINALLDVDFILRELGRRRMTNVLVEGGSGLLGSLLQARAMDEVHVFIAPLLVGGSDALGSIGGAGVETIADAMRLADWTVEPSGEDWYVHGRVRSAK